jgi:hypothetical protein
VVVSTAMSPISDANPRPNRDRAASSATLQSPAPCARRLRATSLRKHHRFSI